MASVSVSRVPYPCGGSKLEEKKAGKVRSRKLQDWGGNL